MTELAVGQESLIGPNNGSVGKALKSEAIGRRRLKGVDFPGGHAMIRGEVSIVSLMQESDLLHRISTSKTAHDRALTVRLVKMAAVMQTVQAGHGALLLSVND